MRIKKTQLKFKLNKDCKLHEGRGFVHFVSACTLSA